MDRRNFFQGTAAAAVTGAVAGCAAPMGMQGSARTPFTVAATLIPVVGSDEMYPVRRIYCIGRNYAAHARSSLSAADEELSLRGVNGQTKQNANLNQMIWLVAEQISKLSEAFELFPGDIIYSGQPENVGPVVKGDVIEMHIDGLPNLSVKIV